MPLRNTPRSRRLSKSRRAGRRGQAASAIEAPTAGMNRRGFGPLNRRPKEENGLAAFGVGAACPYSVTPVQWHRLSRTDAAAPTWLPAYRSDSFGLTGDPSTNHGPGSPAPHRSKDGLSTNAHRGTVRLLANLQAADDVQIPLWIDSLQVVQQSPSPAHHHQKSSPAGKVLRVRPQVLG